MGLSAGWQSICQAGSPSAVKANHRKTLIATQLAQMANDELAQVEGITSIDVEGGRILIKFSDGVVASAGRSELNPRKQA